MNNKIKSVDPGSVAEEMGIESGDLLIEINGKPIVDVMDFLYFMDDDEIVIVVQKPDGEQWELEIEKEYDEVLGLNFEKPILDEAKRCTNQCVFCFIDQLPEGMRETLYFKDDDSRLSFLMGNFVTLTNMNDATFQRIIDYHVSPINISVHTVDPELRMKMLGNRHAGKVAERLKALAEAGIEMNGQVVLCPGFNDGKYLDETIDFLSGLYPHMNSMAIVPIGLTKFRDNLPDMQGVDEKKAQEIIDQVSVWQSRLLEKFDTRFVFAADEFFLLAKRAIPVADYYEGYVQIENGVGLIRQFEDEALDAIHNFSGEVFQHAVTIGTSVGASGMMNRIENAIKNKFPEVDLKVEVIENHFFGEKITVSGLLTAKDIIDQLRGEMDGRRLLLPESVVNSDGLLLDDLTPEDISNALASPVSILKVSGFAFIDAVLGGIV
ncbi:MULTISPECIES: DUF512 domain-containing protein [unclassified Fusibacter]|uniref:DUF512 domain-containing protein n=1 Tax=unclassified Fusibacter TaxID=2624464 RepID=UPI0019D6BB22|nr:MULTISPECIES: DUF512 domain-containing protein [unclassified Fusibacter]MCK8058021.1 DUF512 domain-containing protein [Fusibacter sp. A2]